MPHYLNIESPVKHKDGEAFRLVALSGHEEMSRLFHFTLDLTSERKDIPPQEIVGKPVSFSFQDAKNQPRWFHGLVSRFTAGTGEEGVRRYHAEVVPWLWFLTRTSDCRIFSKKTVPKILEEVFSDFPMGEYEKLKPSRDYGVWEYCVQYRETDFNFVSRLMEQEGIFYYFRHEKGRHVLVLGDSTKAYRSESPEIRYEYSYATEPKKESIIRWERQYQFVSAKYALTDYNFQEWRTSGEQKLSSFEETSSEAKKKLPTMDPSKHELFDFPGEYEKKEDDKAYSEVYMQEEAAGHDVASGTSLYEYFGAGSKFKLTEHPGGGGENIEYALTSIEHSASDSSGGEGVGQTYVNQFTCIPSDVLFRPPRVTRKPVIYGVQSAVVVGPKGKEINTDKFGRVQVQFFWDRRGSRLQKEQEQPCWIRVGQIMAGKNWGAMFIPRVGQEVMVTFLEGDPDRPMITGLVYNADQPPPYNPEEEATKSYLKTNSSPGGDGFNELRFEDKKDKEQIFLHAQRNMDVRVCNDSLTCIGGNRHQIIGWEKDGAKGGDQRELVYQDKHLDVKRNQVEHIEGDLLLTVGKGEASGGGNLDLVVEKNYAETIGGDNDIHVIENRKEKVDIDQSLTVGGSQQEKVGMKHAVEAGQEIHLKAGMTVVIEAGVQLTLKAAGGFVDIGPAGVTIQGTLVNINSGGAPGVGSGSAPTAPQDAHEAKPTRPDTADDHKTGQKSTPYG